jgi:hypothetical protein
MIAHSAAFLRQAKVATFRSPSCTPRIANLEIVETVGAEADSNDNMIDSTTAHGSNTTRVIMQPFEIDIYRHWPAHDGRLQRISVEADLNRANYRSLGQDNSAAHIGTTALRVYCIVRVCEFIAEAKTMQIIVIS